MSSLFPFCILLVTGALIAVQGTANAALGRSLSLPLFTVVFSAIQLATAVLALAVCKGPWRYPAGPVPLWQYLGAVLGAVILVGMAFGIARLGTFASLVILLVGQLIMGLVIDHMGLFGAQTQLITAPRLLGMALVLAGVFIIKQ